MASWGSGRLDGPEGQTGFGQFGLTGEGGQQPQWHESRVKPVCTWLPTREPKSLDLLQGMGSHCRFQS